LNAFRGQYLETAQRLKEQREKPGGSSSPAVDQLDFEFVLFASAVIDYDYIMKLIADFSSNTPGKQTMSREQLIGLIADDSKFIDEREAITEYVRCLKAGEGLNEQRSATATSASRTRSTPPRSPSKPASTACRPKHCKRSSTASWAG
jgi:type I restriction enzyme R subunit